MRFQPCAKTIWHKRATPPLVFLTNDLKSPSIQYVRAQTGGPTSQRHPDTRADDVKS